MINTPYKAIIVKDSERLVSAMPRAPYTTTHKAQPESSKNAGHLPAGAGAPPAFLSTGYGTKKRLLLSKDKLKI